MPVGQGERWAAGRAVERPTIVHSAETVGCTRLQVALLAERRAASPHTPRRGDGGQLLVSGGGRHIKLSGATSASTNSFLSAPHQVLWPVVEEPAVAVHVGLSKGKDGHQGRSRLECHPAGGWAGRAAGGQLWLKAVGAKGSWGQTAVGAKWRGHTRTLHDYCCPTSRELV